MLCKVEVEEEEEVSNCCYLFLAQECIVRWKSKRKRKLAIVTAYFWHKMHCRVEVEEEEEEVSNCYCLFLAQECIVRWKSRKKNRRRGRAGGKEEE
jgi:hypothetical protein